MTAGMSTSESAARDAQLARGGRRPPGFRQRAAGEGRAGRKPQQVDDRGRQVAQADRLGDRAARRRRRGEDQQGDVDLVRVEAEAVVEHAMLAELLAVVRGDDHQRVPEHPAPIKLVEQRPDLAIEGGDAVVVGVAGQPHVPLAEGRLVAVPVVQEHPIVARPIRGEARNATPSPSGGTNGSCASR